MLRSIRSKFIVATIILAILPLMIVGYILAKRSFSVQKEQGIQNQTQTALRVAAEVKNLVEHLREQLTTLIRHKSLYQLNTEQQKEALMELLTYENSFEELTLLDVVGKEKVRVHRYDIFVDSELMLRDQTPEYQIPFNNKEIFFGPVVFDKTTGEPLMNISVPFFDLSSNELKGILVGYARLKTIWLLLADIVVLENQRIYILDSNNRVIAHPNPSVVLRNSRLDFIHLEKNPMRKGLLGDDVLLSYQTIQFGAQSFTVVVERNIENVFALAYNAVVIIAILAVISLVMAGGLIFIVLKSVIQPIHKLSFVANEITSGNLEKKAEIYRDDELGVLSKAFNGMTYRLKHSLEQLEFEIKEKVNSELEIRKLQETLAGIIDSMPSIIIGVDPRNIITHWNEQAVTISQIAKKRALNCALPSVIPQLEVLTNHINTAIETNEPHLIEKEEIKWLDQTLITNITIFPLISNKETGGAVIRIDDITEWVKKEELLIQSQKIDSLGTLAGGLAHDFNNILQPIMGYLRLLAKRLPTADEKVVKYISQLQVATRRAKELVEHILTFSRQSDQELVPVNMQGVVQEVASLIRSSIPTSITINLRVDENCSYVNGNITQLHQVILNLTTNAYHAMQDQGGDLTISLKMVEITHKQQPSNGLPLGHYACLSVEDTGTGMTSEVLSKLFDPYFTTKKDGKGTGLGLSVVRGIVEKHNGMINVSSELNVGSTFTVFLPILDEVPLNSTDELNEFAPMGTEHIMVVDDELPIIQLEKDLLENLGYQVTTKISSEDALQTLLSQQQIALLITDMTMPNMSGEKLAQKVLEKNPEFPIIMCSGFSEQIDEKKAIEMGIKAFIRKPFTQAKMAQTVRKVLDQSSQTNPRN